MRVTAAFSRLLDLPGVWVKKVRFEPGRVVVWVALRRKRLCCPKCSYSTMARENVQDHDSVWRAVDLGLWRLEIRCRLRRLRCPEHGAHVEGVPFARDGARFTRDFEDVVAWLATKTDQTATCRLMRIDWETVGRIIKRVGDELLPADRLTDLFDISLDEVAWRKGHRYLTLVGDHREGCVVWGTEGKGQAAADQFFEALDPPADRSAQPHRAPEPAIMVPFGPCPTVPAGHGIQGAWLAGDVELEPAMFARASRLRAVSMDMTGGYAKSVRQHAAQAEIVIDNYHVVALATKALDEVRREHWNELRVTGELGAAKAFKDARWSLLKNPEHLTDRQAATLAALQTAGGKIPRAWAHKETVRHDLHARSERRCGREADRPPPRPPVPQPTAAIRAPRPHDPQTPPGDPRRPPPGLEQRPRGSAQQQGEADRPPRLWIPLRPSRASAHPPRVRPRHTDTPTRPVRPVTSPTIIHGEPYLSPVSRSS